MQSTVERKGKKGARLGWYALGPLVGAAVTALLLYALAVLLERQILPYGMAREFIIACLFLGSAAGGAAAAKRRGRAVMAAGLISGAALAAVVAVGALMAGGEEALSADCLRSAIAAVAGGAFGSALCLDRGGAKRKKRARRR